MRQLFIWILSLLAPLVSMAATHDYVDLGLPSGTLWATCNVGASSPEGYGSYFAWGETTTKSTYSWSNYKYANGTAATAIYIGSFLPNNNRVTTIQGTQYDAAKAQWGSDWVMPSKEQVHELIKNCSVSKKTVNGVAGVQYKGPNGKTMFIPCAGYKYDSNYAGKGTEGYFWSATGDTYDLDKSRAIAMYNKNTSLTTAKNIQRRTGAPVRAVRAAGSSTEPSTADPVAVDLGLSVPWATFNVGATSKEGTGSYFAWGETAKKSTYTWANYKHASGTSTTCKDIGSNISETQYDAAQAQWGDDWRMPTADEIDELISKCTFTAATVNGVKGYTVKGPSGKTIFLPFAGCSYDGSTYGTGSYTYYWSSEVNAGATGSTAYSLYLKSGTASTKTTIKRRTGAVIRPVKGVAAPSTPDPLPPAWTSPQLIDLGLSVKWSDQNLGADGYSEDLGKYYAWGETSTKSTYTWANYKHSNGTSATAKDIGSDISGSDYDAPFTDNDEMCLPTAEQWQELISKCTFKLTAKQRWNGSTYIDVKGYEVTGPSGKSIFLPLSGCSYDGKEYGVDSYTYYWTANNDVSTAYKAKAAYLTTSAKTVTSIQRRTGAVIRPVEKLQDLQPGGIAEYGIESVDLGLSVNWCNMNVYGNIWNDDHFVSSYFAWGETTTKDTYTWDNYKHSKGTATTVKNIGSNISSTQYDVAYYDTEWWQNEGDEDPGWRMPTMEEANELISKCTWKEVSSPSKGFEVTGPSGNSIFLPFAGCSYGGSEYGLDSYTYIWTSSLDTSNKQKSNAIYIKSGTNATIISIQRRTGAVVRAVCPKPNYVDLNLPSGNLWATCNVGAATPEQSGHFYAWGETETKSNYTWSNYSYDIEEGSIGTFNVIGGTDISGPYTSVYHSQRSEHEVTSSYLNYCLDPAFGEEITVYQGDSELPFMSYMPNSNDFNELIQYCTMSEVTVKGVKGVRFTASNGESVFFPYAGSWYDGYTPENSTLSYYWASNVVLSDKKRAYAMNVKGGNATITQCQRRTGLPIRPVYRLFKEEDYWSNSSTFDTDGIRMMKYDTGGDSSAVYTLQGMKVEGALKPGVYVRSGRKFIVK